jgi:uncharacterized membrane protein
MNLDWHKTLTWLMWLALPITALNYWQAWDRLPARMAVHFDAAWRPNGYTSREGSLMFGIGIMAVTLLTFTIACLITRAQKPGSSWPVLIISYVVLGILFYANNFIVDFNLKTQPARSELVGPNSPAMSDSNRRDIADSVSAARFLGPQS